MKHPILIVIFFEVVATIFHMGHLYTQSHGLNTSHNLKKTNFKLIDNSNRKYLQH
jgi:hypothetical protein